MNAPKFIVGAGLAGLVAGYAFPGVQLIEAQPRGAAPHRAVLRFRSDAVSRLTGIPFRKVRVHKGVWSSGAFHAPNPRLANLYARKCIDRVVGDRSIWNLEPVDRWVAPESLIEQMTAALGHRIEFSTPVDMADWLSIRRATPTATAISTAPLRWALDALDISPAQAPILPRAPIWTRRYRVRGADAHQTVYFPDHAFATYRASLTGDLLIVELRDEVRDSMLEEELGEVCEALGLSEDNIDTLDHNEQRYGKIVPLPDEERRGLLARLTIEAGIYSLGRFATWRNVLLDDVVQDCDVIRRMLRSGSATNFAALRASAGR